MVADSPNQNFLIIQARAYLKQKGTQQTGCGHGSKQTQATANSRKLGAGTQDDQDHSGALAAKPLG